MVFRACLLSTAIAATLLATSLPSAAQSVETRAEQAANPLTTAWNTPDGVPPYDRIRPEHYEPAFDLAIAEAREESARIANDPAAPTFENTIEAMERAGRQLARVSSTFFTVASADATPANQAVQKNVAPKLARLSNEMMLDQALFQRVDTLYNTRAELGLTPEQMRLLEQTHKRFVRAGAALSPEARTRVAAINEELANLGVAFGQKLLADQKANDVFLSEAEVEGLPADQRSAAAAAATAAGQPGAFLFPATRSSAEPFLTAAPNRAAREKIWRAFTYRGDNDNANNTSEEIKRLVQLRIERAELMGAASHADFVLEDSMAKTTDAAMELLMAVYQPALVRAREELRDIEALAAKDGITDVQPWDWRYYAEQVRRERFALDEAEVKQYMPLDGIVDAMFETTQKLFGLTAHERTDIPVYADGVRVFEIREADGRKVGLFYADWFARPTKRPGAWMNSIRVPNALLGDTPIVVNNQNITPPASGERALISLDEAQTLFHEFGHGLHGLLSTARYPSLSGTAVSRDFVEFPSQVYEHWITEPAILRAHARNAAGEPMPEPMLEALLKAQTFNQGFLTVQQLSSAILDMRLHQMTELPQDFDARTWEAAQLRELGVPEEIGMRHRLPHFSHIFDGGYSASYYAYTWAEAMDADGFDAFKEAGNVFDPELAARLRREVYEVGNTRDPAESYRAFRGRMPTADALLRNRGLK
ncbi:M3 family metallopeptidase [Luteimonas sp BLCC-B24]|uniref:M3 family metallopeptidase n=1 Tax=Luteimonas sp. BLCC-B24 TaxID=3025317 RepID=UPI00234C06AF|nr:M3 family metallopeptidase [Luteimonas sp. BLCC-B24]MDC7805244.1 M3 family metallopeptidase [Luteimonas sp. BLCC-B24]